LVPGYFGSIHFDVHAEVFKSITRSVDIGLRVAGYFFYRGDAFGHQREA
jgi:hypothetical protein